MANTFDHSQLSQLNLIVTECSKKYFLIKNQLYNQIKEIQESSMNEIDICHLIDTQHTLIKELGNVVKYLFSELSFRKSIIERKDRALKDLSTVMTNKYIDKIYKQEQQIIELQKEKKQLEKYKNLNQLSFNKIKINNKTNKSINPKTKIKDNNQLKKASVNVIVSSNKDQFNGTVSFFNSSIKNIEKFINIKNVDSNEVIKYYKPKKSVQICKIPNKLVKNRNDDKGMHVGIPGLNKHMRPKSVESRKNIII